jgi:hypothetical protein
VEKMEARKRAIRERLCECLDSYALIGFDPDGNMVDMCEMPSDLHVLAVNKAFKDWYKEHFEEDPIEWEMEWEDGDDD